ncbi:MAG: YdcF family protein [Terracidiphilus sp.]|jgi:uncharacterized SAM-binding protein YcdF (DUF218 family)
MMTLRKVGRTLNCLFAAIGLITVLVISTPIVSWWARAYSGPMEQPKGDVLILLSAAADEKYGGISYSSYWRARQALFAWQTGGFRKIVICGGGGPGIFNFLIADGIPREVFVTEWRSISTRENAVETARLIQTLPGKKVLLTSDFHMYRALRVFRKLGIDAEPMAVPDVLHSTENWYGRFSAFETMLTESAKIVYYAVRGWI